MADMVMAAGIDAARDLDGELADLALALRIGEALAQALGDGNRARIGEAAIVQARAGDDVADEADIRRGQAQGLEPIPERWEIGPPDVGQDEVLDMADADLAMAVGIGELRDGIHL